MTSRATLVAAVCLVVGSLAALYWHVWSGLLDAWLNDGNYSHGFFIPPLAAYLAWERRAALVAAPVRGSWTGLIVLAGAVVVLLVGVLGSELFLTRISLVLALVGTVLFVLGWAQLRILAFPLAFLLLMIPLPAILFNQIAFPLQLLASRVGETVISACNIPVLREGNVLVLPNTSLEVAEACSGIRSLVSLMTLGLVYGYFMDPRGWVRATLVAATVPVAVIANGARVAGTGIAAHYIGPEVAEGFFHEFSGWVIFVIALVLIFAIERALVRFAPPGTVKPQPAVA